MIIFSRTIDYCFFCCVLEIIVVLYSVIPKQGTEMRFFPKHVVQILNKMDTGLISQTVRNSPNSEVIKISNGF